MPFSLRWVGDEDLDRVAQTRWLCYAHAARELEKFKEGIRRDGRAIAGDFLLAERDGQPVGTATSLSMTMWVRGTPLTCQGVAYVGAVKTERRKGAKTPGVASAVMRETIRKAREREQVVTALMPFRASFYEHFGYGLVERRAEWTLPLAVLPSGPADGWREMSSSPGQLSDVTGQAHCYRRMVEVGQCEIERNDPAWAYYRRRDESGFTFAYAPDGGSTDAWAFLTHSHSHGKDALRVDDWAAESPAAFGGLLRFLGTLRDQYDAATIAVPVDWPLNLLLKEAQLPHRPVNHAAAECRIITRMQVRILDHRRFIEAARWPVEAAGAAAVAVHENEGHVSRFRLDVSGGRATAKAVESAAAFECLDRTWAAIACGELPASQAVRLGLATDPAGAAPLLDGLSWGPLPFCHEYF